MDPLEGEPRRLTLSDASEVAPSWKDEGYERLLKRTAGVVDIVLIDEGGATRAPYLVGSYPTTYLIDRNYNLWGVIEGVAPLMGEEFRSLVSSLVNE